MTALSFEPCRARVLSLASDTPTGNAGFRLYVPERFEVFGDRGVRLRDTDGAPNGMEPLPQQGPVAHSTEACIGQKLQLIGDQFHRERVQLVSGTCASC